jgi:DNA-directed RNA polymerase subunit RPC12/RpoP
MNLYRCDQCDHQVEANKHGKKCPNCKKGRMSERTHYKDPETGKMTLYKYVETCYVAVRLGDNDLKTLDHLGRRNYERDDAAGIVAAKAQREADLDKANPLPNGMKRIKKTKGNPWWRDKKVDTSLGDLGATQQHNYIMTGNKNG